MVEQRIRRPGEARGRVVIDMFPRSSVIVEEQKDVDCVDGQTETQGRTTLLHASPRPPVASRAVTMPGRVPAFGVCKRSLQSKSAIVTHGSTDVIDVHTRCRCCCCCCCCCYCPPRRHRRGCRGCKLF